MNGADLATCRTGILRLDRRVASFTVRLRRVDINEFRTEMTPELTSANGGDGELLSMSFAVADRIAQIGWDLVRHAVVQIADEYQIRLNPTVAVHPIGVMQ